MLGLAHFQSAPQSGHRGWHLKGNKETKSVSFSIFLIGDIEETEGQILPSFPNTVSGRMSFTPAVSMGTRIMLCWPCLRNKFINEALKY